MVKIGLLVEGHCEEMILSSDAFTRFLTDCGLKLVDRIINVRGKNNLNTSVAHSQAQILRDQGAQWIVVLRDLDELENKEAARKEVIDGDDVLVYVAIKELEAWFLADSETISKIFKTNFFHEWPEQEVKPIDHLKALSMRYRDRGIDDKRKFTNLMLNNGFTVENAANHPNCPSARYFLDKLKTLASAS